MKDKIKVPSVAGLKNIQKRFKEMVRKAPSPELVKIIEEVTREKPKKERKPEDIAANKQRDLDF